MKPTIESKLRKIIREELDYYFDRLQTSLNESSRQNFEPTKPQVPNDLVQEERKQFRQKYSGILRAASEDLDMRGMDGESNSILESRTLNVLGKNPKTKSVYDALTKDYSALLKKMETK
jgi:hypothetical protein